MTPPRSTSATPRRTSSARRKADAARRKTDAARGKTDAAREVTLRLDAMTYGGQALGRLDGKAIFVAGGLPGETVRAEIEEERSHFARGRVIEVIDPAPDRTTPPCPYFGFDEAACGGCQWQHIDYAAQLRFKTAIVREQLQRLGHIDQPPVRDIIPSPAVWGYRNHAQFSVTTAGRLGFQAARSQHTIPITECLIIDPLLQEWLEAHEYETVNTAVDRRISVRRSATTDRLSAATLSLTMFQIKGARLRVSAESFFQVNTSLIETLIDQVMGRLDLRGTETVLDAYCGVGLFSHFIAARARRVIGIESSSSAVADMQINLAAFDNVEVHRGRVEDVLPTLESHFDAAVFDPPRAGCGPPVIQVIVAQKIDRVVMVSCDPATLARDARQLIDSGYALIEVQPLDMFPHTYHIETVALFLRADRAIL